MPRSGAPSPVGWGAKARDESRYPDGVILFALPAVVLTTVSVAAFFGRWSWFLDFLANARPQYATVLLVLSAILVGGRWRKTATVALVGALVNLAVVVPLFIGEGSTIPPERPLTVLSFNLLSSNQQFGQVVAYIREVDPDVVFLHESSRPWEVAIESVDLDYTVTRSRSEELDFGTLVLSRPGDEVTSFGFTIGGARAVEVMHAGIALLGVHPVAPTSEEGAALRNGQLGFAGEWANDQTGAHLVTGDFNATPWSFPFRRLLADTDLVNSQRGFGLSNTFSTDSPFMARIPIDHLLHSPELVVADRYLGPPMGSDHYPLVVELWTPG